MRSSQVVADEDGYAWWFNSGHVKGKPKREWRWVDYNKLGKCHGCNQSDSWKQDCPLKKYKATMASLNIQDDNK